MICYNHKRGGVIANTLENNVVPDEALSSIFTYTTTFLREEKL